MCRGSSADALLERAHERVCLRFEDVCIQTTLTYVISNGYFSSSSSSSFSCSSSYHRHHRARNSAGKALEKRICYVRMTFKAGGTLTFHIQGHQMTAVTASPELPSFKIPQGWRLLGEDGHKAVPIADPSLLQEIWFGEKNFFIDTVGLLESFRVWTPLLQDIDSQQDMIDIDVY